MGAYVCVFVCVCVSVQLLSLSPVDDGWILEVFSVVREPNCGGGKDLHVFRVQIVAVKNHVREIPERVEFEDEDDRVSA